MSKCLSSLRQTRKLTIFLIVFTLFNSVVSIHAETHDRQIKAHRTYQSIEIDGDLTEEEWQHAPVMDRFVQVEPNEGENLSEPMELRILYDDENIYFGFTCHDSEISKLIANEMRRDSRDLHENDNVFVLLDTYNDKRSGFFFRMNALGAVQDRAITNSGDTFNSDWDAVVACKSKINDSYWTAELSIPFSQLRFEKNDPMTWGINAGRGIARSREEAIWNPVPSSYGGRAKYRTAHVGSLVGLEGIAPSRNLEVLPYILPGIAQVSDDDAQLETTREFKIGFDAKYGITSNLTADVTYNTDFAQVEADEEQVNLTRFSLFFPENVRSFSKVPDSSISAYPAPVFAAHHRCSFSTADALDSRQEMPSLLSSGEKRQEKSDPMALGFSMSLRTNFTMNLRMTILLMSHGQTFLSCDSRRTSPRGPGSASWQ